MSTKEHISIELKELGSSLMPNLPLPAYAVPAGYFAQFPMHMVAVVQGLTGDDVERTDLPIGSSAPMVVPDGFFAGFPDKMLEMMKQMDEQTASPAEELSPLLAGLRNKVTYTVPEGCFNQQIAPVETAADELTVISPLLSGIDKAMPFHVPEGYFNSIQLPGVVPSAAPVIKMGARKWFRYAAAAVVTGLVATASVIFINSQNSVPVQESQAWIEKSMKQVSTDELNEFVQLTEEPAASIKPLHPADMQVLMQDVSDKEIQNFLAEAQAADTESDDDLIFN